MILMNTSILNKGNLVKLLLVFFHLQFFLNLCEINKCNTVIVRQREYKL